MVEMIDSTDLIVDVVLCCRSWPKPLWKLGVIELGGRIEMFVCESPVERGGLLQAKLSGTALGVCSKQ